MNEIKLRDMKALSDYSQYLRSNPRLTYLFFELTNSCNLSCLHCGSNCEASNKTFLPYEAIVKVIDSVAKKYSPKSIMICLSGGEPMLHPDFFKIAHYASSKGFACGITTNGTLITEENATKIIQAGIRSVMLSIDGMEDNHKWLRNSKQAFKATVDGIRNLQRASKARCIIGATTVVHKKNMSDLEPLYSFVSELGLDAWRLVNIEPIGRAENRSDLLLSPQEHIQLLDFIESKRFSKNATIDVTYGCSHYLTAKYERAVRDAYFMCGSGIYVASILCNGDIYSCMDIERRPGLVQGNIYNDDFVDVWENRFAPFREDRTVHCRECRECGDRQFCKGDSTHTWDFDNNKPKLCMKKYIEREKCDCEQ